MAKSTINNGQAGLSVRNALNAMFSDIYGAYAARHVVGNWYCPLEGIIQTAGAPGSGTIRLIPFVVGETVTISDLGAFVTTLSAGGNFQLAIYNSRSLVDFRPGTLLGATGNMSTAATGLITADIAGADIVMTPGLYYFAVNCDNATVAFTGVTATSTCMARLVGDPTATNILNSAGSMRAGFAFTQAFGTWPDLTAQVMGFSAANAAVIYKVSAVS